MDYAHLMSYISFLFLWMVSPGICFALIARNSVKFGVKGGILTAVGMIICDSLFTIFAIVGVAEFLRHYPKVLSAGKIIGAAYILYIGVEILLSTFKKKVEVDSDKASKPKISPFALIKQGFLTDASNPLLIIGMLAIVLQFIDLKADFLHIGFYSVLIPITTTYVTFLIALIFGNTISRKIVMPHIKWFERFAGLAIIALSIIMIIE